MKTAKQSKNQPPHKAKQTPKPKSHHLKTLLKIAFVVLLLGFLVKKGFISVEATGRAFSHPEYIVPAILAFTVTALLGVIRWQWLLKAHNIHLPLKQTFQLTFIGNFFNIALPGAVSGDFVKAFYVGHEVPGRRADAFGSILFDRVVGVSALVLVSAGALLLGYPSLWGTSLFSAIQFFVGVAALAVIAFYSYLFLMREKHDPLLLIFRKLEKRFDKFGSVTRIYEGLRHYHNRQGTVLKALGISVTIHILVAFGCWNIAQSLEPVQFSLLSLYAVVPLGLLVTAIPIAPAGVGTGHAAFGWLFMLLGSKMGANVFSLFVLFQLCMGALGGAIYLRYRSHDHSDPFSRKT